MYRNHDSTSTRKYNLQFGTSSYPSQGHAMTPDIDTQISKCKDKIDIYERSLQTYKIILSHLLEQKSRM